MSTDEVMRDRERGHLSPGARRPGAGGAALPLGARSGPARRSLPSMGALTTEMGGFGKALGADVLVDWGGKARTGPQVDGMGESLVSEILFASLGLWSKMIARGTPANDDVGEWNA